MSFSNLRLFSILIFIIVLCGNVQSRRTRKSEVRRDYTQNEERHRPTRGFSEMELLTAHGFGKRSKNMQLMNRLLMEWLAMGNNPKNSRTSREWLRNRDLDYFY